MADCIHDIEERWCGSCNPPRIPDSNRVVWADAAVMAIPGETEPPMAVDDVAAAAGLTRQQFNVAVAYLRETYPDVALVSDRNGIRFTMDQAAVDKFRRQGARQALTLVRRRFRGAVLPYLRAVADNVEVRRITRQADRLMEDMEDFIGA